MPKLPLHPTFQVTSILLSAPSRSCLPTPGFFSLPALSHFMETLLPPFSSGFPNCCPPSRSCSTFFSRKDSLAHCRPQEHLPTKPSVLFKPGGWLPPFVLRKWVLTHLLYAKPLEPETTAASSLPPGTSGLVSWPGKEHLSFPWPLRPGGQVGSCWTAPSKT